MMIYAYTPDERQAAEEMEAEACDTCRKRWSMRCPERKQNNRVPKDYDWCSAWRGKKEES